MLSYIIGGGIGFLVALVAAVILLRTMQSQIKDKARNESQEMLRNARNKSTDLLRESKREADDVLHNAKRKAEEAAEKARRKAQSEYDDRLRKARDSENHAKDLEKRLSDEKRELNDIKERAEQSARQAEKEKAEYERVKTAAESAEKHFREKNQEIVERLEKVANMTQKEAQDMLIKSIEEDAKLRSAKIIKAVEENTKDDAEKLSKRIISNAISRYSSDYIPERTTSSISLPSDELKGRLIGREGRNIRAIEAATGCDIIIDDTPETVVVSSFDPIRRFVGKKVLEQLISDGRVHPSRIEELVAKNQKEVDKSVREEGEKAMLELGIVGMHKELQKLVGRLKYRYSYNQNQYQHVVEVGHLCGLMAAELNLDVKKARRAGVLHDIGKALTHEIEGSHAVIGADLCAKYGEAPEIVHAVRAHHEDVKPETALDFLVMGADAISGARPGARHEQMDNYIRRISDLERIANEFPGVEKSYAVNAGREIRILVQNANVTDEQSIILSKDIAEKIEQGMAYPGQIKVTVIRETRAVSLAK